MPFTKSLGSFAKKVGKVGIETKDKKVKVQGGALYKTKFTAIHATVNGGN